MSEVKFTKGQWSAHDKRPQCNGFSIFAKNQYVAFVGDSDDNTDCKANAHLIAAAPEMYKMLKFIVDEAKGYESRTGTPVSWACIAEQLLAKARGEQNA